MNSSLLLQLLKESPSPIHAITTSIKKLLEPAGFKRLTLNAEPQWDFVSGGKYYVTHENCLLAFVVPSKMILKKENLCFAIIGSHCDSPCLRVKPKSDRKNSSSSTMQLGVEPYGGGIWHTWFDRDLSIAGKIIHRCSNSKSGISSTLLNTAEKSIAKIPSLAIHLDRSVNESFKFNAESHLLPVIGLLSEREQPSNPESTKSSPINGNLAQYLLCENSGVDPQDILGVDLCLFDSHAPSLTGLNEEFISSARLDNLISVFPSVQGLVDSSKFSSDQQQPHKNSSSTIKMVAIFDHEEVGSVSVSGAEGNFIVGTINRMLSSLFPECSNNRELISMQTQIMANSLFLSADAAHGCHPNYPEKSEELNKPKLGQGLVLKFNSNQRYATTAYNSSILQHIASKHNLPRLQEFTVRNESTCGSTIGPMLSAKLGISTADFGQPLLGMHSIRETASMADVLTACAFFKAFFNEYNSDYAQ